MNTQKEAKPDIDADPQGRLEALVRPYFADDAVTIYHGDCRQIAPLLGDFDLLLTDPPYGIGEKMQGGTWGAKEKYADFRKWDVAPETEEIEMLVVCADNAIIWGGNSFKLPPSRCWFIWDKQNAVPTMADCELAWSTFDKPTKRLSLPTGVHRFGHPTEKPERLFAWCMEQAGDVQTILDPYAGSGTTGRVAKDLGKQAVLIEREERYCEIAAKRMSQQVLSL